MMRAGREGRAHGLGVLLGLALSAAAGAAPQGLAPEVPTRVSAVLTARCERPGFSGLCRAVITAEGFEHVQSRLWLEWLQPAEHGAPRRLRRVAVTDVGMWVLAPGPRGFEGNRLHLNATHTHSLEQRARVLEFGAPGRYRWLDEP